MNCFERSSFYDFQHSSIQRAQGLKYEIACKMQHPITVRWFVGEVKMKAGLYHVICKYMHSIRPETTVWIKIPNKIKRVLISRGPKHCWSLIVIIKQLEWSNYFINNELNKVFVMHQKIFHSFWRYFMRCHTFIIYLISS